MSDARKVRAVEPLDAEVEDDSVKVWITKPDNWQRFSHERFAAHFMPAELWETVLTAARDMAESPFFDWERRRGLLREAVRAFDAYLKGV